MKNNLKGVWVDGGVWECKALPLMEKHLIQKIKDLDNDKGCTAMNGWFAEFLGISKSRVSQLMKSLKNKKMIAVDLKFKGKEVVGRVIKILTGGHLLFKEGHLKINTPFSYIKDPSLESSKESNIVLRNIVKEYKEREKRALSQIQELQTQLKQLEAVNEYLKNQVEKPKENSAKEKVESFLDAEEIESIGNGEYYTEEEWKAKQKKEKVIPPPTSDHDQGAKLKPVKKRDRKNWTTLDMNLHNFKLPTNWPESLKEKVLEYWYYMEERKGVNWGTKGTISRQCEAIEKFFKKFSDIEIIDSLEETMFNGNVTYNPKWTINRKQKAKEDERKQAANNGKSIYENYAAMLDEDSNSNGDQDNDDTIDVSWAEA